MYMCIYIYIYALVYIYIYIYIYTHTCKGGDKPIATAKPTIQYTTNNHLLSYSFKQTLHILRLLASANIWF